MDELDELLASMPKRPKPTDAQIRDASARRLKKAIQTYEDNPTDYNRRQVAWAESMAHIDQMLSRAETRLGRRDREHLVVVEDEAS